MKNIPKVGFGTYRLRNEVAFNSTLFALKHGYNHIDTANLYCNENEIGKAIKLSEIPRYELWITTKIQIKDIKKGKDAMYKSILNSCEQLGTSYLDLVLLHGPVDELIVESWNALEDIINGDVEEMKGKVRFIGVSNYNVDHLDLILRECKIKPYANQFEVSPYLNRDKLISFCNKNNIIVVAHTSLIKGEKFNDERLDILSRQIHLSKSLILLGWALNKGMIVLPRSSNSEHIIENIKCLDIQLDVNTMDILSNFDVGYSTHPQYV